MCVEVCVRGPKLDRNAYLTLLNFKVGKLSAVKKCIATIYRLVFLYNNREIESFFHIQSGVNLPIVPESSVALLPVIFN